MFLEKFWRAGEGGKRKSLLLGAGSFMIGDGIDIGPSALDVGRELIDRVES